MSDESQRYMGDSLKTIFNGCDVWSFQDSKIKAGQNHTVLFNLSNSNNGEPFVKADIWDGNHVRMPNNIGSKYEEIDSEGQRQALPRWSLIERCLLIKFENSYQFENAIKKYNTRYEQLWDFSSFHHLIQKELTFEQREHFLTKLLPDIISLALRIDQIVACPIPLLKQGMNHSISMTQDQAACLLANAFLCTYPRRNTEKRNSEFANYPEINFNRLYGSDAQKSREKLKCILNYFKRVFKTSTNNVITYQRQFLENFPDWKNDTRKLSDIKYHVSAIGNIESALGCLQVDFANRFVGGGVLGGGSVQEEIRFVMNPELIVAKLFTECLDDKEALIVTGTQQFNLYSGYASSFKFAGDCQDSTPIDDSSRRKTRIVAIDALSYKNYYDQFKEGNLKRDINKAFVGFDNNDNTDNQPVATGLWGAGAFQGHPIRSAIIQFMACRATHRNIIFYTFGDEDMECKVADIFQFLSMNNVTIGAIYEILKKFRYSEKTANIDALVPFIKKEVIASAKILAPSTSSFKEQNLFSFTTKPKKNDEQKMPEKTEKQEDDVVITRAFLPPLPRFNDTNTINNDREQFNAIGSHFRNPVPKPIFKQHTSLLDYLEKDFQK